MDPMTRPLSAEFLARFSDALVSEIKAEMGRRDLSANALGRLIGATSSYMSDRLGKGNSKTGQRVVLTVKDLAAIGAVLGVEPAELMRRAMAVADGALPPPMRMRDDLLEVVSPAVRAHDEAMAAADRPPAGEKQSDAS